MYNPKTSRRIMSWKLATAIIALGLATLAGACDDGREPMRACDPALPIASFGRNAVGDFDGDARLDVVVHAEAEYILFQGMEGGLAPPEPLASLPSEQLLLGDFAVRDLTMSGRSDFINLEAIILGAPERPFEQRALPAPSLEADPCYRFAGIADVNGDGYVDLVLVCTMSIAVMYGDGSGSFQNLRAAGSLDFCSGFETHAATMDDVDHDGAIDILVGCADIELGLLRGTADRRYQPTWSYGDGVTFALGAGDFDGDGERDVAVLKHHDSSYCPGAGVLRLHYGTASSVGPREQIEHEVGSTPNGLAVGDLDGDGRDDVVIAHGSDDLLTLLLSSTGVVTLSDPSSSIGGVSGLVGVALADIDGDGDLDIIGSNEMAIAVYENLGDGGLGSRRVFNVR